MSISLGVKNEVLQMLKENPTISYSIIGKKLGVTRERVRQIAKDSGFPARSELFKHRKCPICGRPISRKTGCYCSRECAYTAKKNRVVLRCYICDKQIERTPGSMRSLSGRYFCSRECYKKWERPRKKTFSTE